VARNGPPPGRPQAGVGRAPPPPHRRGGSGRGRREGERPREPTDSQPLILSTQPQTASRSTSAESPSPLAGRAGEGSRTLTVWVLRIGEMRLSERGRLGSLSSPAPAPALWNGGLLQEELVLVCKRPRTSSPRAHPDERSQPLVLSTLRRKTEAGVNRPKPPPRKRGGSGRGRREGERPASQQTRVPRTLTVWVLRKAGSVFARRSRSLSFLVFAPTKPGARLMFGEFGSDRAPPRSPPPEGRGGQARVSTGTLSISRTPSRVAAPRTRKPGPGDAAGSRVSSSTTAT